ncbi:MAG: hypothetical protein LBV12_04090 [Puniceicoccales bacterium]|jgi:hypothetical protein|nr:hypothetical protein [Puniceicoccales bacterium]
MFFIRDSKGVETGPFPEETIRQGMVERRYNYFTSARRANEDKWKMLGSFIEFTGVRPGSSTSTENQPHSNGSLDPLPPIASVGTSNSSPPPAPSSPPATGKTIPPWLMKPTAGTSGSTQPPFSAVSKTPAPPPPPQVWSEPIPLNPDSLRYSLPLWAKIIWGIILGILGLAFLGFLAVSMIAGSIKPIQGFVVLALLIIGVGYALSFGCWKIFNRSPKAAAAGLFSGAGFIFIILFVIPFIQGFRSGLKNAMVQAEEKRQEAVVDSAVEDAIDSVAKKIRVRSASYDSARTQIDFSLMVSFAGITKKDDLVSRRNRLTTLLEKKNQLEQIWSNAAALLREELVKQKLDPDEVETQVADFNKQFSRVKQETARQLEKDGLIIYSLIEMHQLLESEWGHWKLDGGNIMFEETPTMQKYNALMTTLSSNSL